MFNFRNGTALAVQQDQYIPLYKNGGSLSSKQISDMEQNVWVATAAKTAPNNLVLRQWALIDLFKGIPERKDNILKLFDLLSYKETGIYRIWAEGYSYYGYTMAAVQLWIEKFKNQTDLSNVININEKIKQGFIITSYRRNGILYPAPFGDLRDEPLSPELQIFNDKPSNITVSNVTINRGNNITYNIIGRPIGLNVHIPKDNFNVTIINGIPSGFKFYQGYDKKYKNSWDEYCDTFNIKRVRSIPF